MSDTLHLPAETRERAGKGASRVLRREGRVPAVIYGGKEEPTPIHVEAKELVRQLGTGHFMNSIVMIEVGGKKVRTLPKDVAFHPVTDRPIHVDFLRLTGNEVVTVTVPVHFVDQELSAIKTGAMLKEMPRKYWKNMPETALVAAQAALAACRAQGFQD